MAKNKEYKNYPLIPIEETYMHHDLYKYGVNGQRFSNITPNGFLFKYPSSFLRTESQHKLVGLRRLEIIPPELVINIKMEFYDNTGVNLLYTKDITITVLPETTLIDFIETISQEVATVGVYSSYEYTRENYLFWEFKDGNILGQILYLEMTDLSLDPSTPNVRNFLRVLNRSEDEIDQTLNQYLNLINRIEMRDVWSRREPYFHASFSKTNRRYLGKNKELWEKPSKWFTIDSSSDEEFLIWFTTDGQIRIPIHSCDFHMDLTFVHNHKKLFV
jgi:hypothetical protein